MGRGGLPCTATRVGHATKQAPWRNVFMRLLRLAGRGTRIPCDVQGLATGIDGACYAGELMQSAALPRKDGPSYLSDPQDRLYHSS
jgi:hypothetical protein